MTAVIGTLPVKDTLPGPFIGTKDDVRNLNNLCLLLFWSLEIVSFKYNEHAWRLCYFMAMVYIFLCGTYLPHSYFTSHRRDGRLGSLTLLQAQKSLPKIPWLSRSVSILDLPSWAYVNWPHFDVIIQSPQSLAYSISDCVKFSWSNSGHYPGIVECRCWCVISLLWNLQSSVTRLFLHVGFACVYSLQRILTALAEQSEHAKSEAYFFAFVTFAAHLSFAQVYLIQMWHSRRCYERTRGQVRSPLLTRVRTCQNFCSQLGIWFSFSAFSTIRPSSAVILEARRTRKPGM